MLILYHISPGDVSQAISSRFMWMILSRILLFLPAVWLTRPKYRKEKIFQGFYKEISAILFIDGIYLALLINLFRHDNKSLTTETTIALSVFVLILISALSIYLL